MDNSWENLEPSPIEFFHGLLLEKFHEFRRKRTDDITVLIDGSSLSILIAECKKATYEKYNFMNLDKAIPKSAFENNGMKHGVIGIHMDELRNVAEIIAKLPKEHGHVIIVGNSQEHADDIPLRPRFEDIEPLLIKSIPRFVETIDIKRTNHERQPASFSRKNKKRR